jgi:hypothetical protein
MGTGGLKPVRHHLRRYVKEQTDLRESITHSPSLDQSYPPETFSSAKLTTSQGLRFRRIQYRSEPL